MTPNSQFPVLESWYDEELGRIYSGAPVAPRPSSLVMACPVWGAAFCKRFVDLCVASFMSEKNKAALKGRCRLVLFVDGASRPALLDAISGIERHGIEIQVIEIPPAVLEDSKITGRYYLLGTCQKLGAQVARRAGMAFHMLQPDHVHNAEFFPNLFRLRKKHPAIAQTGISAAEKTVLEALEKYRNPDLTLEIGARELVTLGMRNLHKQMVAYTMAADSVPNKLPESHFMLWRGTDKLVIHAPHLNVTYLSPELVAEIPPAFGVPSTVDTELPNLAPKGAYVSKADDGLAFIEISDDSKVAASGERVSFARFARRAWGQMRYSTAYLPWMRQACEMPCDFPNAEGAVTDEQIEAQLDELEPKLREVRAEVALENMMRLARAPDAVMTLPD